MPPVAFSRFKSTKFKELFSLAGPLHALIASVILGALMLTVRCYSC